MLKASNIYRTLIENRVETLTGSNVPYAMTLSYTFYPGPGSPRLPSYFTHCLPIHQPGIFQRYSNSYMVGISLEYLWDIYGISVEYPAF
jgi:hypothetical protein